MTQTTEPHRAPPLCRVALFVIGFIGVALAFTPPSSGVGKAAEIIAKTMFMSVGIIFLSKGAQNV